MKKTLSIILSAAMLLTTLSIGFTAYADMLEEKAIDNFVENSCEIIREYDADKDFISEDENVSVYSSDNSEDFQTCRLIVKADGAFNDFGAAEHIKGFMDFHILQYENETDTENAYNSLLAEKNVLSVSVDKIVSPAQADKEDTSTDVFPESSNGHLCDWATERTQSAQVNEYIKENNIPLNEVTVGVVDTGVDYNHRFLQERIKRTYFNSSSDGDENDELDLINGHGTAVSSVVVDNTPECVSIAVYRVVNNDGNLTTLSSIMGILKAVEDNVDIINASFGGPSTETDLENAIIDYAYNNDIPVVCCAGNEGFDVTYTRQKPADIENVITVSATSEDNRNCFWSNSGLLVDISAPGENVNVAVPNNKYDVWSGTSFSTPCVSGIIALIKSVYANYSNDEIMHLLKSNALRLKTYYNSSVLPIESFNNIENFKIIDEEIETYGNGLVQIWKIFGFDKIKAPEINYSSGNYVDEITVELQSDYPIYYTIDGTYPTTSSELYTAPIIITEDTNLRAVAYCKDAVIKYSNEIECEYQVFEAGTDGMFQIDNNGCIISYTGNIRNLLVPNIINGKQVTAFNPKIFNDEIVTKLILPDTVSELPQGAFAENNTIQYINTGGAKIIQKSSFLSNKYLYTIDMPNVIGIETEAFSKCRGIYNAGFLINAPKLDYIKSNGFYTCDFFILNAPNITTLYSKAFNNSGLCYASFPKLKQVLKNGINRNAPFYQCDSMMILDLPVLDYCECTTLANKCNSFQQINLPTFSGTISNNSSYEFLQYYNITKETAELSGLDYYDVKAIGGTIRVTDAGMRFGFSFDENQTDNVEEYGFVYSYSQKDKFVIGDDGVKKAPAQKILTEDNITKFNLVFTSVPKSAYEQIISARAYVKIDGQYYYSNVLQRSFSGVANAVLNDESIGQDVKDRINEILNGGQQ